MPQDQLSRELTGLHEAVGEADRARTVKGWKLAVFWLIFTLALLILVELLASTVLLYRYRYLGDDENHVAKEAAPISIIALAVKVLGQAEDHLDLGFELPRIGKTDRREYRQETVPYPFFRTDSYYGYSAVPGRYLHEYHYRESSTDEWSRFAVNVTIEADGSRWTGTSGSGSPYRAFILGDSFVFGSGVHDEQTFGYLLQQSLGMYSVKLFALPGYSLAQAYLRVVELGSEIGADDVVILGYANFYDDRHVVDPKRLRDIREYYRQRGAEFSDDMRTHPRILVSETGEISVEYIAEDCERNNGYCDRDSYSREAKTRTTAALINAIAQSVEAPVYVLYFRGERENPVFSMLDSSVRVVAGREEDFTYFVRDRVEQFDSHPGPYWHHAMFQKLREEIPFSPE